MTPRRRTALVAAAVLASALTACGGSGSSGSGAPATGTPTTAAKSAQPPAAAPGSGSDGLTPVGTRLALGKDATVAWVPPSVYLASKNAALKGFRLQVTVESIEKGSIEDFKNVQLNANERAATPYYVTVSVKALGTAAPTGDDDPDLTLKAYDDRGQPQASVIFLGEFKRCADNKAPKPFANGKSYKSCLTYLMPGGGSIQDVRWNGGPNEAGQVTPYFSKPIVWSAA
ncbi:hypothetical protein ABZ721_28095 [Streptomyces sp. NPDC006733]|uniref:hypothetical protein n=1 Tax=Streptomyces sp. NPDC006733 TaxID=3155460 RepID=UPI0033C433B6